MDTKTLIIVLIPSVLAIIVSLINIILSARKELRRNDDIVWETAKEIFLNAKYEEQYHEKDAEDIAKYFHHLYQCLLAVKGGSLEAFLKESEMKRSQSRER